MLPPEAWRGRSRSRTWSPGPWLWIAGYTNATGLLAGWGYRRDEGERHRWEAKGAEQRELRPQPQTSVKASGSGQDSRGNSAPPCQECHGVSVSVLAR